MVNTRIVKIKKLLLELRTYLNDAYHVITEIENLISEIEDRKE